RVRDSVGIAADDGAEAGALVFIVRQGSAIGVNIDEMSVLVGYFEGIDDGAIGNHLGRETIRVLQSVQLDRLALLGGAERLFVDRQCARGWLRDCHAQTTKHAGTDQITPQTEWLLHLGQAEPTPSLYQIENNGNGAVPF